MNNSEQKSKTEISMASRRRRYFIDATIQGRLLVALIGLEVILFGGAMIWLYLDLSEIIDAHLYRVHYADIAGSSPFINTLLTVIPVILLVNVVALWFADMIWRAYVRRIVNQLRRILSRISNLDLRDEPKDHRIDHDVIQRACNWLENERDEFQAIKNVVKTLPVSIESLDENELTQAKVMLRELHTLL